MDFALTILGVSGAAPAYGRFTSAQFLQIQNSYFLIDCGEGTQIKMNEYGIPRNRIIHIFISHLHGDHIFGLPGLLFSLALNNRKKETPDLFPPGLREMINAQMVHSGQLPYPLEFIVLDTSNPQLIYENETVKVISIPLLHRIPTCGFKFEEKPFPKNIIPEKIQEFQLDYKQIKEVKAGKDLEIGGKWIPNEELTLPPMQTRSFAYFSDTAYAPDLAAHIKNINLLYHESTFCEADAEHAVDTTHSTAKQAAQIAHMAMAETLVIGHFSPRYSDLSCFLKEAKEVFPNTILGQEGSVYKVERLRMEV